MAFRLRSRHWLRGGLSCCAGLVMALTVSAASAQDAKPAEKVNFTDHVLPIFRAKCGTCHSAGQAKGGLVLESFSAAMQGGASGTVVEAGDLDGSRLWVLVTHKEQPAMPPKEPRLPDEMLAVIQKWIEGGALENKDSQPKIKKKASMTLSTTGISGDKPEGPPPMPENLSTSRAPFRRAATPLRPWRPAPGRRWRPYPDTGRCCCTTSPTSPSLACSRFLKAPCTCCGSAATARCCWRPAAAAVNRDESSFLT